MLSDAFIEDEFCVPSGIERILQNEIPYLLKCVKEPLEK